MGTCCSTGGATGTGEASAVEVSAAKLCCQEGAPPGPEPSSSDEEVPDPDHLNLERRNPFGRTRQLLNLGVVRLLSAQFLIKQGGDFRIKRLQDLPEEALLPPELAVHLYSIRHAIVVVSYGWLSKLHPDPTCFHMPTVQKYLAHHLKHFGNDPHGIRNVDMGVFWDFASLPQCAADGTERTSAEQKTFKMGLGAINFLYGGQNTTVIQLTNMPKKLQLQDGSEANLTPYETRGWCFFEAVVSSLLKGPGGLLDLGLGAQELDREGANWLSIRAASVGRRQPPVLPEDMAEHLGKCKFTNGADVELVRRKYQDFVNDFAATADCLKLANGAKGPGTGWGDAEISQLARALPSFTAIVELRIDGHHTLGEAGLARLRVALREMPRLGTIFLPLHLRDTEEGQELRAEWLLAGKKEGSGFGLIWR